jgi:hypothetical protein
MPDRESLHVAEFHGDGISSELSASVHQVAKALPIQVHFHPVDLTLESRRKNATACYDAAMEAIRTHKLALKYPTVTEKESPNKVLRERCQLLGDPPAGGDAAGRQDAPRRQGRPAHHPHRRRRHLRGRRPPHRRRRRRVDPRDRTPPVARSGALRVPARAPSVERRLQHQQVHDPARDRRPVRGDRARTSRATSPKCRTTASCSTRCSTS